MADVTGGRDRRSTRMATLRAPPRNERATDPATDVLAVFAVFWAMATLFHVWVNPWSKGVLEDPTMLGTSHVALSIAALVVLCRPRSQPALGALAVLGLATAWIEAPVLGNHWLLAALVNLGLLLALVVGLRGDRIDGARLASRFLPVARWTLLAFYAFAALAKLNHAFLTPKVSCAVYFSNELLRSLYLGVLDPTGAWARLLPAAVVAVEVAIPLLLAVRRTRHLGVVVGLGYHSVIGLNMTHPFADFSSVLTPLFILFLPPTFAVDVVDLVRRNARLAKALRGLTAVASALVLVLLWSEPSAVPGRVFLDARAIAWLACDVAVLVLVLRFLHRPGQVPAKTVRPPSPGLLLVVPALVVLNGLSPYLELKTGYGWNMYSNLETVNGQSNHLLVPRTLALSKVQRNLVRIEATNDPGLGLYVTERYDLPFRQLRAYLNGRPGVSLVYERGGERRVADPVASDPALVRPVPGWKQKLQPFRAVDQSRPSRCQPAFLPAH